MIVDDIEFRVLDFFFGFFQNSDYTGRPVSTPNANPFKFVIEASKDITFVEWAMHATMMKKRCKIVFSPVNGMSKSTTIELLDVHCIFCQYHFSSTGNNPLTIDVSLSPATIIRDGEVLLKRHWAVTDPAMLNVQPTVIDNGKKVTNYYLTNTDGEAIDDYKKGDIIVLNIETRNRIGDSLTIDLNDAEYDFEYNGDVLPNDTLRNIVISNDLEQIELKVVEQKNKD